MALVELNQTRWKAFSGSFRLWSNRNSTRPIESNRIESNRIDHVIHHILSHRIIGISPHQHIILPLDPMSSPHLGGEYLNALTGLTRSGSRAGGFPTPTATAAASSPSGRSTPRLQRVGSPFRQPAQFAYGRPQSIHASRRNSTDDEDDQPQAPSSGWRPITPSFSPSTPSSIGRQISRAGSIGENTLARHGSQRMFSSRASIGGNEEGTQMSRTPTQAMDLGIGMGSDDLTPTHQHQQDIYSHEDGQHGDFQSYENVKVKFSTLPPELKGYLIGQIAGVIKCQSNIRARLKLSGERPHN